MASFIGLPPMNLIKMRVMEDCSLRNGDVIVSADDKQRRLLTQYIGGIILMGIRPEGLIQGNDMKLTVRMNENLGQYTLIDGSIGKKRVMCKLKGWFDYKSGDVVGVSFDRNKMHYFDVDTKRAIKG